MKMVCFCEKVHFRFLYTPLIKGQDSIAPTIMANDNIPLCRAMH